MCGKHKWVGPKLAHEPVVKDSLHPGLPCRVYCTYIHVHVPVVFFLLSMSVFGKTWVQYCLVPRPREKGCLSTWDEARYKACTCTCTYMYLYY